ncbi:hypothetical protein I6H88_00985 [Elizabethkingia bruuniana]|uniref:Lipoprotein n=1 Tax=Elizabethkingia bruuniana TaxID=1756149 RepID=A0A7T7UZU5_9FLAO|nr:hypothetical protein [Elizabethkingia bruuniana]KGO08970.1 hypothetical protein KS04_17220 [Elizabethkingia miricola]AQX87392.1 hypothetical protein AYC65_11140 [Elizabethkingia bruuniana]KUY25323.1 hypothetical protein ATB97_07555 [Elizabethkingia bruuniana]OPB69019.1 hypothetical protein BAY12_01940 [Elizabethkingia bruuniana]QDZ62057.1 hypothetical protein EVD20_03105 [Elizabethkingia bruuniana]
MKKTFLVLSILSLFACQKKTETKEINAKDSITIKKDTVKADKTTIPAAQLNVVDFKPDEIPAEMLKGSTHPYDMEGESIMELVPSMKDFIKGTPLNVVYIDLSLKKAFIKADGKIVTLKETGEDQYANNEYKLSFTSKTPEKLPQEIEVVTYAYEGKITIIRNSDQSTVVRDYFAAGL